MSDLPKPPEGMFWRVLDDPPFGIIVELRQPTFWRFSKMIDRECLMTPRYESIHYVCEQILERVANGERERKIKEDILNRYGGDNDRM